MGEKERGARGVTKGSSSEQEGEVRMEQNLKRQWSSSHIPRNGTGPS